MNQKKVNFLCIGTQKAGTTWLHEVLKQHPDIFLPKKKEIHYFNTIGEGSDQRFSHVPFFSKRGKNILKIIFREKPFVDLFFWIKYYFFKRDDLWYRNFFKGAQGQSIIGEITPNYSIMSEDEIETVYKYNPDMKILLIIRNPIEREWSAFKMHIRNTNFNYASMSESEILSLIEGDYFTSFGNYPLIIKNWLKFFPKENICIELYDDLLSDSEMFVRRVLRFLKIMNSDNFHSPLLHKRVFEGQNIEMPNYIREKLRSKYKQIIIDTHALFQKNTIMKWLD